MANLPQKPTILVSLAHPDDESFGIGGTIALYAERGVDVHLICATNGEVGTVDPEFMEGYDAIADLRISELECAAEQLGLAGVHLLGYRDSGMPGSEDNHHANALASQPIEAIAADVVHCIRELRPQVVITFDPIGGYRHPDHIAIQKATVLAFHSAGYSDAYPEEPLPPYQPEKLYFSTYPKGWLRFLIFIMRLFGKDPSRFGRNNDVDLTSLVGEGDFPVHVAIDYQQVADKQEAAAKCHASQMHSGLGNRWPLSWVLMLIRRKDYFMRAYPEAEPGLKEQDLFEGIKERV